MKEIKLTQGKVAMIDDEDFDLISQHRWHYVAGYSCGYAATARPCGKGNLGMHRFLVPCPLGHVVDHINGNSLDNRRCNLRVVTRAQNRQNSRKRVNASSQFKGVSWYKPKRQWHAMLTGQDLGFYDDEAEAARVYDAAAKKLYGEFAWLNFPEKPFA